ncbi:MAG: hypothetical protein NUV47_01425 [Patescibacteria group bacterium]|nr:hypothetical protein [Patescibacteria group bacterium]
MSKFFVILIGVVAFVTTVTNAQAQTFYSVNRPVYQKSSGTWSSEMTVKKDPVYFGGSFPPGASRYENHHSSSSWTIDVGSYQASSYKSSSTTSTPTYDYVVGKPTITTQENKSSSFTKTVNEQVMYDRYGRPLGVVQHKKGFFAWFFGSKK